MHNVSAGERWYAGQSSFLAAEIKYGRCNTANFCFQFDSIPGEYGQAGLGRRKAWLVEVDISTTLLRRVSLYTS